MLNELEALTHLMEEGIPASKAFRVISIDQPKQSQINWARGSILLEQGALLSRALEVCFRRLPINLIPFIRMADSVSRPHRIFSHIIRFLRHDRDISHRITGAVLYPLSVLFAGEITGGIFLLFGLPSWLSRMGLPQQPFLSTILPWLLTLMVSLSGISFPIFSPFIRSHIPFFGRIHRLREEYRIFRFLQILTVEGFPLAEALDKCRSCFTDESIRNRLSRIKRSIDSGYGLTTSFLSAGRLTKEARLWLRAAESTGQTGKVLTCIAGGLEKFIQRELDRVLPFIEPLFLLLTGILLLPIILSVLTPLFSLMESAV